MSVDVTIRTGDCPCPGTPHTEEHVFLEDEATLPIAIYAYKSFTASEGTLRAKESAMLEAYIPRTIKEWSFVDELGQQVPVTQENAERLIPWDKGGYAVLEKANDLYTERVLQPFLERFLPKSQPTSRELPTGQKDESTSATRPSGSRLPALSKSSSPTNSAG